MRRTVVILAALSSLAACTLPGSGPSSAPPSAPPSAPSTSGATTAQPTQSSTSTTAPPLPVIASRAINLSGRPATVILNEVVVRDGVTSITWTLRNDESSDAGGLGIQMTDQFGDGQVAVVPGTDQKVPGDSSYVDGVYLLDTANRLRYLPARDSEGHCVCTYAPSSVFIRPGASQSFDAVFKALPDGVNTIDVVIPRAGTFRGVQAQR